MSAMILLLLPWFLSLTKLTTKKFPPSALANLKAHQFLSSSNNSPESLDCNEGYKIHSHNIFNLSIVNI